MIVLFFIIIFLSSSASFCYEMIAVKNKTHIMCATSSKLSIYVLPPVLKESKPTTFVIEDDTFWSDDWLLKNSTDVVLARVSDKRWEDFDVIKAKKLYFDSVASIGLSSYGGAVHGRIYDVDKPRSRTKRDTHTGLAWSHHYVRLKVNETDDPRFHYTAETDEESYWRIHKYKLRWADTVSETPHTIVVSPHNTSCLILYMFICPHCTLNVDVIGDDNSFHGSYSGSYFRSRKWKSVQLLIKSENTITLLRNTTNEQHEGIWALDIRHCPLTISGLSVYKEALEEPDRPDDRVCRILGEYILSSTPQKSIFDCDSGLIGQNCNLSCSDLVGLKDPYCYKHSVCDNSLTKPICRCARGYYGPDCNQTCPAGTWGTFDKTTGLCANGALTLHCSTGVRLTVSVSIGIIFLFF